MVEGVRNALQNSVFQVLGAFSSISLNFLLTLGYGRFLGPEFFGLLVTSMSQVLIWLLLVDLGLSNALISVLTKLEVRSKNARRQHFRARDLVFCVFTMRFWGATLGAIAVFAIAYFRAYGTNFQTEQFWREVAFTPFLYGLAFQQTAIAYSNFRGRQKLSVLSTLLGAVVTVSFPLYFAWKGYSVAVLLFFQSLGSFVSAIVIGIFFLCSTYQSSRRKKKKVFHKHRPWLKPAWRALFKGAWPYAITFASVVIWQRMDVIVASSVLGYEAGGQYGMSVKMVGAWIVFAVAFFTAQFPSLQRTGNRSPDRVKVFLGAFSKFLFRYGVLIILILLVLTKFSMGPLVPQFVTSMHLLLWFLPGIWSYWLYVIFSLSLLSLSYYKEVVFANIGAAVLYLGGLFPLTYQFGLLGTVFAYNLYCVSLLFLIFYFLRRKKGLSKKFFLWKGYTKKEKILLSYIYKKWHLIFASKS